MGKQGPIHSHGTLHLKIWVSKRILWISRRTLIQPSVHETIRTISSVRRNSSCFFLKHRYVAAHRTDRICSSTHDTSTIFSYISRCTIFAYPEHSPFVIDFTFAYFFTCCESPGVCSLNTSRSKRGDHGRQLDMGAMHELLGRTNR